MMPMLYPELSAADDACQQGLFDRLLDLAAGEKVGGGPGDSRGRFNLTGQEKSYARIHGADSYGRSNDQKRAGDRQRP
jgi:hypothetical protein